MRGWRASLAIASALVVEACGDAVTGPGALTKLRVTASPNSYVIYGDAPMRLIARAYAGDTILPGDVVRWTSRDTSIVTVDGSGTLHSRGRGKTFVIVEGAANRDSAVVKVVGYRSVAVGETHTCALWEDELSFCWGANGSSQLGTGSTFPDSLPTRVQSTLGFFAIAAGAAHTCAIALAGTYCWGRSSQGQLGGPSASIVATPRLVATAPPHSRIAAAGDVTCSWSPAARPSCWGANDRGQLGRGSAAAFSDTARPITTGEFTYALSVAPRRVCAALDTGFFCWGDDVLGDTIVNRVPAPHAAFGGLTSFVATNNTSTCAGTPEIAVRCARYGQPGSSAALLAGWLRFSQIAGGGSSMCGVDEDAALYCWGANDHGQLGVGDTLSSDAPRAVSSVANIASIVVGPRNSCALSRAGALYCWGANESGQIGDGTHTKRTVPVLIRRPQ